METVRVIALIAGKDLRQRLRDRSALVLGFVAPLVIAAVMSFAFRGTESFHTTLGFVDEDHGPVAAAFMQMLRSNDVRDVVTVRRFPSAAAARSAVDRGKIGAAIVVPSGFTAAAHGGPGASVGILASVDTAIDGKLAGSLAESFASQLSADRLAVATAVASGASPASLPALGEAAARLRVPEQLASQRSGRSALTSIDYYAPAMAIFFAFFAIGFGARSFFAERRNGTLDRIVAAPVPPWALLAGKALSTFTYAVVSLTTMAVVTVVAFDADWGPPLATAVLIVCLGLVLVSLTALVTALARTERQADGLASIVTFGLVLLGGNFIVLAGAPDVMRHLALLTPNGWALRGFTDLATGAPTVSATLGPALAILAFALVTGAAAALLSRRAIQR